MSSLPIPSQTPQQHPRPTGDENAIRSFVHCRSRMTRAQRHAYERLYTRWSLPYALQPLDFDIAFNRQAPTILEIGSGMGETTAHMASCLPDYNFLAVEILSAGVGALLKRIEEKQLENIRIIQYDAVKVVHTMIAPATLAGAHIYFPDPWPKKRHHKRRLIQTPFVTLLASRLMPGGYLHCATDWAPYAAQMLEVLSAEPLLHNTADGYTPRPEFRPQTKFETRGLQLGHGIWDLMFKRDA
jgi:tRNA (guanine-N7-)-methyltransferase